jgi:hypothetical protein
MDSEGTGHAEAADAVEAAGTVTSTTLGGGESDAQSLAALALLSDTTTGSHDGADNDVMQMPTLTNTAASTPEGDPPGSDTPNISGQPEHNVLEAEAGTITPSMLLRGAYHIGTVNVSLFARSIYKNPRRRLRLPQTF